ncbi:hypothetical protein PCANC_07735 [Puccinia coronata f. sp. avenae]|uniref:Uncharacterized protein n=1 Tax=Puccinia coronata f. sp. avenae TaxID=200324 RepID=A0A2N5U158_9BASI|nr:hypothetical protein PCASD_18553 [Puccinia coronata f. sp. avenae]PLW52544.1 hypothetical protein PCANC_07735 [Puccinia coronata f. sp. avenae]
MTSCPCPTTLPISWSQLQLPNLSLAACTLPPTLWLHPSSGNFLLLLLLQPANCHHPPLQPRSLPLCRLTLPASSSLKPHRYQFLAAHHRRLSLPNTTGPRCPPSPATTALQLLPLQSRPLPPLPPDLASLVLPLTSPLLTSHPRCPSLPLPPATDSPATQPARRPRTLQSLPTTSTCNQRHHPEWQLQLATSANHQHPRYRCPQYSTANAPAAHPALC